MKTLSATRTAGAGESWKIPTPTTGEVSLYFHLPFCTKKCPYCHFYVIPDREELKKPFIEALCKEWRLRLPLLEGKKIVSIYFGGGTPTKIPPELLEPLLVEIRAAYIDKKCEITLEANPEDITLDLMQKYRALGINRVSIGVQTFNPQELRLLGRTHSSSSALEAIAITADAGVSNLSIDLMYELPKQTLPSWEKTLETLSSLPITHLSLYNLTFEPHTPFHRNQKTLLPTLPKDLEAKAILDHATATLPTVGFDRYEISAFAKKGAYSRHNTGYWLARPFLGFGPSAYSYWEGERSSNISHIHRYLDTLSEGTLPTTFREKLPPEEREKELLAIQLRLTQGVHLPTFTSQHGPLEPITQASIEHLIQKGWLETVEQETLRLTQEGQLFYDSVAIELI